MRTAQWIHDMGLWFATRLNGYYLALALPKAQGSTKQIERLGWRLYSSFVDNF